MGVGRKLRGIGIEWSRDRDVMESNFYNELFSHFMAAAWREAPEVAADDGACRAIFHDRILFPARVGSVEEAESRLKGVGREFRTPQAYKNFLYTIFKNAIIDHLRERQRAARSTRSMDQDGVRELASDSGDYIDPEYADLVARIINGLSREERRLLSLRYVSGKTLVEISKVLGISKSTVDRRGKLVEQKLVELANPRGDYEPEDLKVVFSLVLEMISEEDDENE